MNKKIKYIIIPTQDYYPVSGGVTTWCYEIAKHLIGSGYRVKIMTKSFDGYDGREDHEVPVIRLDHKRWKNTRDRKVYKAIKPLISEDTLFLCANWKSAVPCMLHSLMRKINYFVAIHGMDAMESRKINKLLQRKTMNKSSGLISVSNYTYNLANEMIMLKASLPHTVINNGVDINKYHRMERNPVTEKKYGFGDHTRILSLGRLIERKGFDTNIGALKEMKNRGAHYYICGRGPYENKLKKLVNDLGLADRVHFLGFVPDEDIADVYNCADIFSMPCRRLPGDVEGFGITYVEAGACGVPCIAGSGSGAEDAVLHEKTGLLVNPDSIRDVAAALDRLIENEDERNYFGQNAEARVKNELTWSVITKKIEGFLLDHL